MEITSDPSRSGAALGFVPLRTTDVLLLCGATIKQAQINDPTASLVFRLAAGSRMARQKELESPTFRLGGGRSIQLSYWRISVFGRR